MKFILTLCFCILAFSESLESTNKQLRRTNEALLETLRELAVGEDTYTESKVGTIYVGNLPSDVSERQVEKLFKVFGDVKYVHVPVDKETGRSRGFGFVEMDDEESAIEGLDGTSFNGRTLKVNKAGRSHQGPSESTVGDAWGWGPTDPEPGKCRPAGSVTNSEAWCDLRSKARCSKCRYGYYWYWGSTYCCTDEMYQGPPGLNDCKCEYKNE